MHSFSGWRKMGIYTSLQQTVSAEYVYKKEIKGPTLLSHKTEIDINSQYFKFEKIPVVNNVKEDEPQRPQLKRSLHWHPSMELRSVMKTK